MNARSLDYIAAPCLGRCADRLVLTQIFLELFREGKCEETRWLDEYPVSIPRFCLLDLDSRSFDTGKESFGAAESEKCLYDVIEFVVEVLRPAQCTSFMHGE